MLIDVERPKPLLESDELLLGGGGVAWPPLSPPVPPALLCIL